MLTRSVDLRSRSRRGRAGTHQKPVGEQVRHAVPDGTKRSLGNAYLSADGTRISEYNAKIYALLHSLCPTHPRP